MKKFKSKNKQLYSYTLLGGGEILWNSNGCRWLYMAVQAQGSKSSSWKMPTRVKACEGGAWNPSCALTQFGTINRYGCIWRHMVVYGCILVYIAAWLYNMGAYGRMWMRMVVYGCIWPYEAAPKRSLNETSPAYQLTRSIHQAASRPTPNQATHPIC